jgi:ABC-type uncharacterized transport system ATPase subunit
VLALADRIIVMREGHIQGQLAGADATEEAVMRMATHEGASASARTHNQPRYGETSPKPLRGGGGA